MLLTAREVAVGKAKDPAREEHERNIRVPVEIAEMLGWIRYFEGLDTGTARPISEIVAPILRGPVAKMFAPYQKRAEQVTVAMGREPTPGQVPKAPGRR